MTHPLTPFSDVKSSSARAANSASPPPYALLFSAYPRLVSHHDRTQAVTSRTHAQLNDASWLPFSITLDESVHTVTLSARLHSPHRPAQTREKHAQSALLPVPPILVYLASLSLSSSPSSAMSTSHHDDDDDGGPVRPRQRMAAGSKIGGVGFQCCAGPNARGGWQSRGRWPTWSGSCGRLAPYPCLFLFLCFQAFSEAMRYTRAASPVLVLGHVCAPCPGRDQMSISLVDPCPMTPLNSDGTQGKDAMQTSMNQGRKLENGM